MGSAFAALPIQCFRDMAKMLPDTPAKLKEIDQMTDVRVEKFGHVIFAVCKAFIDKRMAYLADKQAAEMMSKEEEFQENDFGPPPPGSWISNTPSRGRSRYSKGGWGGKRGGGKSGGGYRGKKRASSSSANRGAKRARGQSSSQAEGSRSQKSTPKAAATSTATSTRGGVVAKPKLMGMPKPRPGMGAPKYGFM